jgi:hypothetical protein
MCAASSCGPDWSTDAAAIPTSADRRTNECDAIRILLLPQLINHYRPYRNVKFRRCAVVPRGKFGGVGIRPRSNGGACPSARWSLRKQLQRYARKARLITTQGVHCGVSKPWE